MNPILVIFLAFFLTTKLDARESAIEAVDKNHLRVCADPANLPFSNEEGEGFENDIAELLGSKLNIPVVYEYFPQVIGYVRNTLNKKKMRHNHWDNCWKRSGSQYSSLHEMVIRNALS